MSYSNDTIITTRPLFHYPFICCCKFVAGIAIGLFSGAVFPLALKYTPPVSSSSANISTFDLNTPINFLGNLSTWGFGLAYILAPPRLRHPYLAYATILSIIATWKWSKLSLTNNADTLQNNSSQERLITSEKESLSNIEIENETSSQIRKDDSKSKNDKFKPRNNSQMLRNDAPNATETVNANSDSLNTNQLGNDLRIVSTCSLTAFVFLMIGVIFHH